MKYFFSISLLVACAFAFYFAVKVWTENEKRYTENRLFSFICLSSGIWNFGFGGLILQTNVETAYIWRAVGMVGVFLYIFFAQMIICQMSHIKRIYQWFFNGIAALGFPLYFFVVQKEQTAYYLDDFIGMTYRFRPGLCNTIYTAYSIIVAVNILIVNIYMLKYSERKKIRAFGKKLILVEILVVIGMVLDTLRPLLGYMAIPGSSITQFLGLVVLYNTVQYVNRFRINKSNISEFVYSSLAIPLLVYDSERRLRIVNDTADVFLGGIREKPEMGKTGIAELFEIEDSQAFEFEGKHIELDAVCRNNHIFCSLAISRIEDDFRDVVGYIIIVTDMSERINAVNRLEKAMNDAENANRAKSTFLASMSHEIRTPMNVIVGFSELVLKMDISPEIKDYVGDINRSALNLLAIINDILDISKLESGKMELVLGSYYITTLLNDVTMMISEQAKKKGLLFTIRIDDTIPNKLYGDKIRLRGVLINILNNAVKYTKKGSVVFTVTAVSRNEQNVLLEFKVADTGIGIREEEKDKIFTSFSQMDRRINYGVEGSGLGLSIVKGYIDLMGGEISVDSVYGEGSTFTVRVEQKILDEMPIAKSYIIDDKKNGGNGIGNIRINGVRVLVVDDNHINLKVAGSSMRYYGLSVDVAANGNEAIECCRKNRYKMIFMDQMMPEMDGIETMKRIRRLDSYYDYGGECCFIVLTADAINGVRDKLLKEGFDEYLGKPINFKQVERMFVRILPFEQIEYLEVAENPQSRKEKQEELPFLKEKLPGIEVEKGIENCGGKLKDYQDVLKIILDYGEKQLDELSTLKKQQDYENFTIKIHSMKSTSKNIGASAVSELALKLEEAGRQGNYSYIDDHAEEFQREYRVLIKNIEEVLAYYHMTDAVQEKDAMNEEVIYLGLQNIRNCIENYEFTRVFDLLDEIEYRIPEQYNAIFKEIRQKMDGLEVEEVLNIISEALQNR